MNLLKYLFEIEKKPHKGILTLEWLVLGYITITLLLVLFTYTKMQDPDSLIWGRVRILALTAAMWGVYNLLPCRFTMMCRVGAQMLLLTWWYPETYELNRVFPNLDHHFASLEQQIFGCQPALLFSEAVTNPVFSELVYMGYLSYYPLIGVVMLYFYFRRYDEFLRTAYVILGSFFFFYIIFVFLPVTGPQYYYAAAGLDNIAKGIFPNVHDYFATHDQALTLAGYRDGFFYQVFADTHVLGERPTAAFPSSHVGICTILLFLAWRAKSRGLFLFLLPFYILMSLATIYIRAHYIIDVFAGWIAACLFYLILQNYWKLAKRKY